MIALEAAKTKKRAKAIIHYGSELISGDCDLFLNRKSLVLLIELPSPKYRMLDMKRFFLGFSKNLTKVKETLSLGSKNVLKHLQILMRYEKLQSKYEMPMMKMMALVFDKINTKAHEIIIESDVCGTECY